jgi:putative CocE/NonD family hydrolase
MFHPFDAVERGYTVYVQDARGRFNSDGDWIPIHGERDDGYDTVEWASAQPWSNGKVGVYGSSYMGVTALQALASRPPHLAAGVVYLTGANYYDGWVYSGGVLELMFVLRWCAGQAMDTLRRSNMSDKGRSAARERLVWILDHPEQASRFRPLIDVFGPADPLVPHWRTWLEHPEYDAFWQAADPLTRVAEAGIPILSIAGWYDGFLKGHIDLHDALTKARFGRSDRPHEDLILGPWDHEAYLSLRPSTAGDASFGVRAVAGQPGLGSTILDWFDRWLGKTREDGTLEGSISRYFVIGASEWRSSKQWPPSTKMQRLYLSGSRANSSAGSGRLEYEAPITSSINAFVHDPGNPVPTVGGRHLGYWYGHAGIQNQAAVEQRSDVLVFTSEPLSKPLTLAGAVQAELYVQSTMQSADFALKLVDVRPDGYCANVADGIRRVNWPVGKASGNDVRKIAVDLWHSAYLFGAGHRLRLEIAGSNFPRFDVNDGIGGGSSVRAKAVSAPYEQKVLAGTQWPSSIAVQLEG